MSDQEECEDIQEIEMPEECTLEMQSKDRQTVTSLLAAEETGISQIIDCEEYSSTNRLFRVTAYVLKFVDRLKNRSDDNPEVTARLSAQEISRAESLWIRVTAPVGWRLEFRKLEI